MASGSKKKNRNKKQQRKPHKPLPKVGTPADNAYRMHESREELIDFGMNQRKRGPLNAVIIIAIVAFLALGLLGLLLLT
jgi:hypothetical protein